MAVVVVVAAAVVVVAARLAVLMTRSSHTSGTVLDTADRTGSTVGCHSVAGLETSAFASAAAVVVQQLSAGFQVASGYRAGSSAATSALTG